MQDPPPCRGVLRHEAELTGNVAHTCRYYGITRPTFYRWLSRSVELDEEGPRDHSSRRKTCLRKHDQDASSALAP